MALCSLPYGIGFCILSQSRRTWSCANLHFLIESLAYDFYKYTDKGEVQPLYLYLFFGKP